MDYKTIKLKSLKLIHDRSVPNRGGLKCHIKRNKRQLRQHTRRFLKHDLEKEINHYK